MHAVAYACGCNTAAIRPHCSVHVMHDQCHLCVSASSYPACVFVASYLLGLSLVLRMSLWTD